VVVAVTFPLADALLLTRVLVARAVEFWAVVELWPLTPRTVMQITVRNLKGPSITKIKQ
jgi:hypothetical protein